MAELPAASPIGTRTPQNPLTGILWMLVTGFLFVAVTASVKQGAADLPAAMSAFLRYVFGLAFLLPMIGRLQNLNLSNRQLKLFGLRGAAHSIGVCCWFYAMTKITIAEVTAMNHMTPIYVTLAAALFLGEKLAMRRIVAILLAFIGALIILRPGLRDLADGHLAMVFSAVFFAVSYLIAKRMADELPASVVVAMLSITVTIGLFPLALAAWQWPSGTEALWILLVAIFATAGHYTMTRAFAAAPVSVTQPMTFLQLVWSVLLGYFIFSEAIDIWVILGGLLIILSASFIAIREAYLGRAHLAQLVDTKR